MSINPKTAEHSARHSFVVPGGTIQWQFASQLGTTFYNSTFSQRGCLLMKSLTQFGLLAEKHWRRCLPRMVAQLESQNCLEQALMDAEERTAMELDDLRRHL